MSLFNLVRGGSKKRVNFLCTSVEGGDYVPTRCHSLMINAREGKEEFKPRRGRSENRKDDKEPNEEKGLRFWKRQNESVLLSTFLLNPVNPPTHQPAVYQLHLPGAFLERPPPVSLLFYRTALILSIGDSLSRKTRDLLVGVSTVSYKLP